MPLSYIKVGADSGGRRVELEVSDRLSRAKAGDVEERFDLAAVPGSGSGRLSQYADRGLREGFPKFIVHSDIKSSLGQYKSQSRGF